MLWKERWEGAGIGFGLRQTEVFARDSRHVSCEACCLVRMVVSNSDSCHKAESPFLYSLQSFQNSRCIVCTDDKHKQRVNDAHHHDPILEVSHEHLNDEVMEKMVFPWKPSGLSPKRSEHMVQNRTFDVMKQRVGFTFGHPTQHVSS